MNQNGAATSSYEGGMDRRYNDTTEEKYELVVHGSGDDSKGRTTRAREMQHAEFRHAKKFATRPASRPHVGAWRTSSRLDASFCLQAAERALEVRRRSTS